MNRTLSIAAFAALALVLPGSVGARELTVPQTTIAVLHAQAVAGEARAQHDLAIVLLCGVQVPRDAPQAALWLALASAQGHDGAQSVLGWQLMTGTGVNRDEPHAARWLHRAAQAGDTTAQNNLGVLYALGHGVVQDRAQAERWFRAAAAQGAADAQRNLELLLGEGRGAAGDRRVPVAPALHPALSAAACGPRPRAPSPGR